MAWLFISNSRSRKTCSQNIATLKPFPSYSTFTFVYHTGFSFLSTRLLTCLNSRFCVVMVFWSWDSLIDKQVKRNVLTAKKLCMRTEIQNIKITSHLYIDLKWIIISIYLSIYLSYIIKDVSPFSPHIKLKI